MIPRPQANSQNPCTDEMGLDRHVLHRAVGASLVVRLRESYVAYQADKQTKVWNNYMKNPLPVGGNGAGAVAAGAAGLNQVTGGLGIGSVNASAVTSAFNFLTYTM